jgi:hypothetical protein
LFEGKNDERFEFTLTQRWCRLARTKSILGGVVKVTFIFSLMSLTFFCGAVAQAQQREDERGSIGGGYIYQFTQGTTGQWTSSQGWYVLPTFNINKQVGVFADFANFYAKNQNAHVELYGALHGFLNKSRYTPFVFIGPGFIRDSYEGNITHSFAWCTGAGLSVRITKFVAFQTIPIEYVDNTANGNTGNNLVLRAGFAFTIPKQFRNSFTAKSRGH